MLTQFYPANSFRYCKRTGKPVGTVPVGTIVYLQDRDGFGPYGPTCVNPWIVEAWHNRQYHPGTAFRGGDPRPTVWIRGSDTATVRSLRDGRRTTVSAHFIHASLEATGQA